MGQEVVKNPSLCNKFAAVPSLEPFWWRTRFMGDRFSACNLDGNNVEKTEWLQHAIVPRREAVYSRQSNHTGYEMASTHDDGDYPNECLPRNTFYYIEITATKNEHVAVSRMITASGRWRKPRRQRRRRCREGKGMYVDYTALLFGRTVLKEPVVSNHVMFIL